MAENRFIVTINRECGAGGRVIAEKLGNLLGVKVYDRAILNTLTEKFNLSLEKIEQYKATKTNWWDDFVNFYRQFNFSAFNVNDSDYDADRRITSKQIYEAEAAILRGLAEKESCIIVGRTGFHIFRDDPRVLKILIIADEEFRVRRFMEKYGKTEEDARRTIREVDKKRETYTKTFAGISRYDARNYDATLNVSGLDPDIFTAALAGAISRRFNLNQ